MKTNFFLLIFLLMTGCAAGPASEAVPPAAARQIMTAAWQADQHVVWQVDWPTAPLNGAVTVETWRGRSGWRLEILEAPVAAWWGQTLVFDGQTAWLFNRFEAAPPLIQPEPRLSPVTDAFNLIDRSLQTSAQSATKQTEAILQYGLTQKTTLIFNNDDQLTFWLEPELALPVRIMLTGGSHKIVLRATHAEKMTDPPPGLFMPPPR